MPHIYKIKKDEKMSKKIFTLAGAREIRDAYLEKGQEVEIVLFKRDVKILDFLSVGEVQYYWDGQ